MRLADFEGCWHLDRRIEGGGEAARFEGTATLTPQRSGVMLWQETGRLHLQGGVSLSAERRYLWIRVRGGIVTRFEDGRDFFSFDPAVPIGELHHDCPPDIYRGWIDLSRFPVWILDWRVSGPRKDYETRTVHRREPPARA